MNETIGVKEAVQELKVSERTIRRWLASGELPSSLVETPTGKTRVFSRLDAERLKSQRSDPPGVRRRQSSAIPDKEKEEALLIQMNALKQLVESQTAEIRDLRLQVNQLHGEVLKSLPAPRADDKPASWWQWWKRKE